MIDLIFVENLEFLFNLITIIVSIAAVVYWVKLFRKTSIPSKQDQGWMWFLASVLIVLLLNLSTQMFFLSGSGDFLGLDDYAFNIMTRFLMSLSRTIMAISLTAGAYMLYDSMKSRGDVKFMFRPVEPAAEPESNTAPKYELDAGYSYLIDSARRGRGWGAELFTDLVTHGKLGFVATRDYPPRVRENYNLTTTPMVWLSQDKEFSSNINPSDLTELSHVIKDFILKCDDTVVLLDGIEYLILYNGFEDVLKVIEGLNDVIVKSNSRIIITADLSTLTKQQIHLLRTEVVEYDG
jgi:hypothetical protein